MEFITRLEHSDGRHSLQAANRVSVEGAAIAVWLRLDLPSTDAAVDRGRRVHGDLRSPSSILRSSARYSLAVGVSGQRYGQSTKGGCATGPNPTDRAKLGVKRHVLTDERGVPLSAIKFGPEPQQRPIFGRYAIFDAEAAINRR